LQRWRRGWSSSEQASPRTTPVDLIYIEESDEEGVEYRFVEEHAMYKDVEEGEVPKVGM
jgi:hypothetical protein